MGGLNAIFSSSKIFCVISRRAKDLLAFSGVMAQHSARKADPRQDQTGLLLGAVAG